MVNSSSAALPGMSEANISLSAPSHFAQPRHIGLLVTDINGQPIVDALVEVSDARGVKPARVALAWLLSVTGVVAPIIGSTREEHIEDAVESLAIELTDGEIEKLEKPYRPHPILGHDQPGPRDF